MGTLAFVGYGVLGPVVVAPGPEGNKVKALNPCVKAVHQAALAATSENKARALHVLLYFAKPIDRTIQAVAAPIFRALDYLTSTAEFCMAESYGWKFVGALGVIASPVFIPALLILGILEGTAFLANGALQIVCPYQTIYALVKGKEAAREYFDFHSFFTGQQNTAPLPAITYSMILKKYHSSPAESAFFAIANIVDKFAKTAISLLVVVANPLAIIMPLSRAVAVA